MAFEVRYSTRAYREYEQILDYVFKEFGSDVAVEVDLHFEEVIDQIAVNPFPKKQNIFIFVAMRSKNKCLAGLAGSGKPRDRKSRGSGGALIMLNYSLNFVYGLPVNVFSMVHVKNCNN